MASFLRRLALRSLLVLAAGCVGTPIPQPPALDPPDADRIAYEMAGSITVLVGGPGAVLPGTTLWGVNLDGVLDPQTTVVNADGSFSLGVFALPGQELRVQTRDGDERSRPVDLRVPRGEIVRRTEACLTLEPALELRRPAIDVGMLDRQRVRLTNGCEAEVVIDEVVLRRPSDAWSVATPGPITLPAGASSDLEVVFQAPSAGLHEEILFVVIGAPEADRRPITLSGEGR
jgi:hypothetical protein